MANKPPAPDPIFEFFRGVHIIAHLSQNRMEKALPGDMLLSHFSVLSHLVRRDVTSPAELAEAFQVARPSMTNTLSKLEKMAFVSIKPDPNDGRAKIVAITAEGAAAHQQAIAAIAPLFGDIVEGLGAQAFIDLLPGMNKVKTFLDENRN